MNRMTFPRRRGMPYRMNEPPPPNSCTTPNWDVFIQHTQGSCDPELPEKPMPCFQPNQREVGLPLRGATTAYPQQTQRNVANDCTQSYPTRRR